MAYRVTLRQLMTRARQRSNDNSSQFVTDGELADMVSQSYAEFYDLVRGSTFGGQYYRSVANVTTVAGTASYALPADFCAVISVDIFVVPGATDVGSAVRSATRFQEEQRNMFRFWPTGGWTQISPIFYDLQGPNITFIPLPQAAHSVNINYVPIAAALVDGGDAIDSINGWDEWIVLDVAIKLLQKGNKTERIAQLMPYLQRQEARILAAAPQRDLTGTERVHETAVDYEDWY